MASLLSIAQVFLFNVIVILFLLILLGVGDATDDTIFQTEFLKSKAKLLSLLPLDAFVLVTKFDKEESKGFYPAAKQFVQFFGRLGIQVVIIGIIEVC